MQICRNKFYILKINFKKSKCESKRMLKTKAIIHVLELDLKKKNIDSPQDQQYLFDSRFKKTLVMRIVTALEKKMTSKNRR